MHEDHSSDLIHLLSPFASTSKCTQMLQYSSFLSLPLPLPRSWCLCALPSSLLLVRCTWSNLTVRVYPLFVLYPISTKIASRGNLNCRRKVPFVSLSLSLSRCLFVRLILSPLTIHSTFGDHMHTGHHTWCLPLTHVSLFLPLFTLPLSLTRNNKLAVQKFNHTHRLHVRIQVTFYCTEQISIQKVRGVPKYTQVYLEYFPSLSPSLSSLFMMLIKLSLHNLTYTSSSPFSSLPLHSFIALLVFMALSFTPSLPAKHVIYTTYINPMATAK